MTNDLHRLPSRNFYFGLLESIQHPAMPTLHGTTNSTIGQITHTDERANNCQAACGNWNCDCPRARRAGNPSVGKVENDGGATDSKG